jgi:hypothetical protein
VATSTAQGEGPRGETASATAATPTRRTRADPSHQGSARTGLPRSPRSSPLRTGIGCWLVPSRILWRGERLRNGRAGERARPSPRREETAARHVWPKREAEGRLEKPPFRRGGSQGRMKRRASRKGCGAPITGSRCLQGHRPCCEQANNSIGRTRMRVPAE